MPYCETSRLPGFANVARLFRGDHAFANVGGGHQHFDGRNTAGAVGALDQALADDRAQRGRELQANLLLLRRREHAMIRLMVSTASRVCSVEKTMCPVSAACSAVVMVSRSRISPTRMTSGSWRRLARSALPNDGVSTSTSRWLTNPFLSRCRNSIGSSMVMMCSARVELMRSIIAASVVDLPEPVTPVTSTSPRASSQMPFRRSWEEIVRRWLDLGGDDAEHHADVAALLEDVDTEAAQSGDAIRHVEFGIFLELLLLPVGHHAERHVQHVLGGHAGLICQRDQFAIHADVRIVANLQVKVGWPCAPRDAQQIINVHGHG